MMFFIWLLIIGTFLTGGCLFGLVSYSWVAIVGVVLLDVGVFCSCDIYDKKCKMIANMQDKLNKLESLRIVNNAPPHAPKCELKYCPPGLFICDSGSLGFKSEYGEPYVVESGEVFWGGAKSREERDHLVVTPLNCATITDIKKIQ